MTVAPAHTLAPPECQCCGFDLSSTPPADRCPECGALPRDARARPGEQLALFDGAITILLWMIPAAGLAVMTSSLVAYVVQRPLTPRRLLVVPALLACVAAWSLANAARPALSARVVWTVRVAAGTLAGALIVRGAAYAATIDAAPVITTFFRADAIIGLLAWAFVPAAAGVASGLSLSLAGAARHVGLPRVGHRAWQAAALPPFVGVLWAAATYLDSRAFTLLFPVAPGPGQPAGYARPDWSISVAQHAWLWSGVLGGAWCAVAWALAWRIRIRVRLLLARARPRHA